MYDNDDDNDNDNDDDEDNDDDADADNDNRYLLMKYLMCSYHWLNHINQDDDWY